MITCTRRSRLGALLSACLVGTALLLTAPTARAEAASPIEGDATAPVTVEGVACSLGENVGGLATTTVTHELKTPGTNPGTGVWELNGSSYQYVRVVSSYAFDNSDREIQPGDYFEIALDPKIRVQGIVTPTEVVTPDAYAPDDSLIAVSRFDPAAHTIRYYFTDAVADLDSFTVQVIGADYVDQSAVKNSGTQTFTSTFAGTSYSYTYDVSVVGGLPADLATGGVDVATGILYDVSPIAQTYQTRYHLGFRDGAAAVFTVKNDAALGTAKVYAYPDTVPTSESFGDDPAALIDVTSEFTQTPTGAGMVQFRSDATSYRRFLLVIDHASANATESVTAGTTHATSATTFMYTAYTEAYADAIKSQYSVPCPEYPALTVKKIDAETGAPLAGATFTLTGRGVVTSTLPAVSLTSGEDGTVKTAQLHKGVYLLEEASAPQGYVKSTAPIYVRVNSDGTIDSAQDPAGEWTPASELTLSVVNSPEPPKPPVADEKPEAPAPQVPAPQAPHGLAKTGVEDSTILVTAFLTGAALLAFGASWRARRVKG